MSGVEPTDDLWEEAEDLLALVAAGGYELSRDQLRRLHQHDVIGRPRQVQQGAYGSEVLYPPGTGTVLLEVCELKCSERRLDRIAWALWWRGLVSPSPAARRFLLKTARGMGDTLSQLVGPDGELSEQAEDALDEAHHSPAPKPLRRMRRRVGSERFGEVLQSLLLIMLGHVDRLGPESLAQVEHALGIDRARTDILGSTGRPWLEGDVREDMANIGRLIDPARLEGLVDEFTDGDLDLARDEVHLFVGVISNLAHIIRLTIGNWAYGMAAWGLSFDDIGEDAVGQAMFVLMWLSCKQAGFGDGMAEILKAGKANVAMRPQFDALVELRQIVPAIGDAVPLKLLGKPMRDPSYQQQINETFAKLRQEHGEAIDAFLASRDIPQTAGEDRPTAGEPSR